MALNNRFTDWFVVFSKTIYFEIFVSIIMISIIFLQTVNTYSIWNYNTYYSSFRNYLEISSQRTKTLSSKVDYLNSTEYKDENLKNQGYKYPSEQIWELNQKEVSRITKNQLDMIKNPAQSKFENLDRWLLCLNLTNRNSFWLELEFKKSQLLNDKNQNKPVLFEGNLCKRGQ